MCHYILLKKGGNCTPANLAKVMCLIAAGNYVTIHFEDKTESEQCGNLGLWEDRINRKPNSFLHIDRSHFVNCDAIKSFSRAGGILFISGLRIDLSPNGCIALAWFFEWGGSAQQNENDSQIQNPAPLR